MARAMDDDEDSLFTRSLVRDNLSRISEGSNEAGSMASSAFQSAISSSHRVPTSDTGADDRAFRTAAGVMRLAPRHAGEDVAGLEICAPRAPSISKSSAGADSGSGTPDSAEDLRKIVKEFVEAGVRGRRIEALRCDGQVQPVMFRLSRQVDAFEIAPENGKASHTVRLAEVTYVCGGDDAKVQADLAASLPGLNAQCAVVDLRDGRCLSFRFPNSEAKTFVLCMQLFVNEVRRETCH